MVEGIIEEIEEFVHQFEEGEINALEGIVEIHHLVSTSAKFFLAPSLPFAPAMFHHM